MICNTSRKLTAWIPAEVETCSHIQPLTSVPVTQSYHLLMINYSLQFIYKVCCIPICKVEAICDIKGIIKKITMNYKKKFIFFSYIFQTPYNVYSEVFSF